jgi:hypothetical protein
MRSIDVSPRRIVTVLAAAVIFLVIASSAGQFSTYVLGHGYVFGLVNLFSLDREGNVPTWFSASLLLACAFLLSIITLVRRMDSDRWWRYWCGLAVIFLYLSMDEAASIHELTITPVRNLLDVGGIFHWAWVIPGMIFVAAIGLTYFKFVLSLPRRTRTLFVVAAAVFLGGALGVEMAGAAWFEEFGRRNLGYVTFWTAEETLEMAGLVIFVYALLRYIETEIGKPRIIFQAPASGGTVPGRGVSAGQEAGYAQLEASQ